MPRQTDGAARFQRQRHDARAGPLRPQFVGQCGHEQAASTLPALRWQAVCHRLRLVIVGAFDRRARFWIPPRVGNHAVRPRQRSRADGEVAGTRVGVAVRVFRAPEDRAFIDECLQPGAPVRREHGQVIGAELIGDGDDHQAWRLLRRGSGERPGDESRDGNEESAHVCAILAALGT
jgi:hypothetical protein